MSRQISFIHEGVQYFTFDGSKYLRDSLGVNAATLVELSSKPSYAGEMRKLNDGSPRFAAEFPIVKDAAVEKRDGLFYVTGTVSLEGVNCNVSLDADGVHFEKTGEESVVEESHLPADEMLKQLAENTDPEFVVGEVPEAEPVVVEAPVVEESSEVEDDTVTEVTVKEDTLDEEEDGSTAEEEVQTGNSADVELEENHEDSGTPGILPEGVQVNVGIQFPKEKTPDGAPEPVVKVVQEMPKPAVPKKRVGFTFGDGNRGVPTGVQLGVPEETVGCVFQGPSAAPKTLRGAQLGRRIPVRRGGAVPTGTSYVQQQPIRIPNNVPAPKQVPVSTQQEVVTEVPNRTIAPAVKLEKPSAEEPIGAWAKDTPIGERELVVPPAGSSEALIHAIRKQNGLEEEQEPAVPTLLVQDEISVEVTKDCAALKKELRSRFSPEVNKVIGDIPLDMLENIDEFTTNPIEVDVLNRTGDMFCIDHRWHKVGKWFCIDVIPDKARYFYNSRLGVSIQIDLSDLRAWAEALK